MKLLPFRWIVLFGILSLVQTAARAEDEFRIKTMREIRSVDLIQVKDAWVKDPKRILTTVRVKEDAAASAITLSAYFFDKDDKLILNAKPNPVWMQTPRGFESVGLPTDLQKGKDIDVYFCVTQELEAKKWKSVVVVFGNSTSVIARSLPATALAKVSFPEKDRMVKEKPAL